MIIIISKKKRSNHHVDFAVSANYSGKIKEIKTIDKYLEMARKLKGYFAQSAEAVEHTDCISVEG